MHIRIEFGDFLLLIEGNDSPAAVEAADNHLLQKLKTDKSQTNRVVYANVREIIAQLSETDIRRLAGDHHYDFDDSDMDCS